MTILSYYPDKKLKASFFVCKKHSGPISMGDITYQENFSFVYNLEQPDQIIFIHNLLVELETKFELDTQSVLDMKFALDTESA